MLCAMTDRLILRDEMIFASCGSLLSETTSGLLKNGSLHPPNLADINLHSSVFPDVSFDLDLY